MNISYAWLTELAPGIRESPEELADRLGMLGAPVEDIASPGAGLDDIVVARVLRYGPHPNADRLSLCEVDAGTGAPLQVVCGAPVIDEGGLYPFAPVGAMLPGGTKIRKAKIRGETSNGMLCSERELGLGRAHEGIMRLHGPYEVGAPFVEAMGLRDTRLTIEVTPNRPDLLSHVGIARELAPDGHHGIELPPFPMPDTEDRTDATMPPIDFRRADRDGLVQGVRVCIDDTAACPRYIAVVIEGVRIEPSPDWLAARLRAIGQRPINNVVDATNFVLHELGQPLHAFDLDRLEGPEIVVRRARAGETIVTLDDEKRKLTPDMLVIADAAAPIAVAGVMGGADSEVTGETSRILLECAFFEPAGVRAAARDLGLSTEASYRFERGADIEGMERAVHRAVELIEAVAGGRSVEEALDIDASPEEPPVVSVRPARVERVLGCPVPPEEIESLLTHIGFELRARSGDRLTFGVPGFRRHDVTREVDLIEEVARRYGYDRLDETLRPYRPNTVPDAPMSGLEDRLRDRMVAWGLLENRGAPMAPEGAGVVPLLRPLSAEEGFLRSSLCHGLIRALELNMARGVRDVRLFEIGTTFHAPPDDGPPAEETRLAAVVSGGRRPDHWTGEAPRWDIWDARALLEELATELGLRDAVIEPGAGGDAGDAVGVGTGDAGLRGLAPAGTFDDEVLLVLRDGEGRAVGIAGRVAPAAADLPAWASDAFAVEVRLEEAMAHRPRPLLRPVPRRPPSDRDLALLVPRTLPAEEVSATIRESAGDLLDAMSIFDVYTGPGVAEGTRSIAYRLVFRHPERTLKDEEVDAAVDRILATLQDAHGVERRG